MSDLMTVGDDEATCTNSQIVSVSGEEEKEYRSLNPRLSDVDESVINSPSFKPTSPFKINPSLRKESNASDDDFPKSPDKKKDPKNKKKGKEKPSPDGKGFLSHMKKVLDDSKNKSEKGSMDSIENSSDRKSIMKSNKKYRSKDSINVFGLSENDTTVYGSFNNIINGDGDGPIKLRNKTKKLSLHENLFYSQSSMDKTDDDTNSTKSRGRTESCSVITNNGTPDANDTSNANDGGKDSNMNISEAEELINPGRRNGQGNIMINKNQINNLINSSTITRDKDSEIYLKDGYDWVVRELNVLSRCKNEEENNDKSKAPNSATRS